MYFYSCRESLFFIVLPRVSSTTSKSIDSTGYIESSQGVSLRVRTRGERSGVEGLRGVRKVFRRWYVDDDLYLFTPSLVIDRCCFFSRHHPFRSVSFLS